MAIAVDARRNGPPGRRAGRRRRRPPIAAGRLRPRGARGPARRAQRRLLRRRDPLDRARPGARRAADVALPERRSTAARDALRLAARDDLQGGRRGARPRRRQGRDLRARRAGSTASAGAAALLDFGDLVESLDGRYITAEDVGIAPADMVAIAERTAHVTGLPPERGGSGDPSPFTAIGVEAAIRACVARALRRAATWPAAASSSSASATSARALARRLAAAGCELIVSDIDAAQARARRSARRALGRARTRRCAAECDVLAPCALGGAIDRRQRRRGCAARSSAARPTTSSPTRRSPSELAARGDPLRARLHRQRRRADQRLPRAPGLLRGARASSSPRGIEADAGRVLEPRPSARDDAARRRARARRASGSTRALRD